MSTIRFLGQDITMGNIVTDCYTADNVIVYTESPTYFDAIGYMETHGGITHEDQVYRFYDPDNFDGGDAINQALSAANVALYGVVYSAVNAMGLVPGLGFVHQGHDLSFVYDIADLYKADITIPIAFQVASEYGSENIGRLARLKVRTAFVDGKIFAIIVRDMQTLLGVNDSEQIEIEPLQLWDNKEQNIKYGVNYSNYED